MRILVVTCAFALFYILCIYLSKGKAKWQDRFLMLSLAVISVMIGLRSGWPDQGVYQIAFEQAPLPWDFDFSVEPYGYAEKGYYFLCSLVKLFTNNVTVYFLAMGSLSMYLLYKGLTKYCAIPLLGLCDYVGRFLLNRDFVQMRSSLAILLIILAVKLIHERKLAQYMLVLLLAYQFHHLAPLGVPLYFLYKIRLSNMSIIAGLLVAMLLSQLVGGTISDVVDSYSQDLNYDTYVQDQYVEEALGLRNPMIYMQIAILLMYTFMEKRLAPESQYYHLFRWAYFYSTLILIFFCNYTALSGRTSTVFATCEMFMLPSIAMGLKKSPRMLFYIGTGLVLTYFFWSKYRSALVMMGGGAL